MRVTLEPAYALHCKPYRDSSLIVELWTAGCGRIAAVARGARRPKSRLHGLLQPFRPLLVSWSGRGELATLTQAEARGVPLLGGRLLISGFYVNELLLRLLARHDPHPQLYGAYEAVLRGLSRTPPAGADPKVDPSVDAGIDPSVHPVAGSDSHTGLDPAGDQQLQRALRSFEKTLLRELGYGLVLDHDAASGEPVRADAVYYYYPERGPVARGAAPAPAGALELSGHSLLALARDELYDERSLRESKRLMRAALETCLGGRPVHSRALFKGMGGTGSGAEGNRESSV